MFGYHIEFQWNDDWGVHYASEDDYHVGVESLKVRHDVTKLDLTIPLLSLWCIDIDLSIQTMTLTLYITCVH